MNLEWRLTMLVKKELDSFGRLHALARAINSRCEHLGREKAFISSKLLDKIIKKPESCRLTLKNLRALNEYFKERGEGLEDKPLFEKEGILRCLAEGEKISLLVAAKPRQRRVDLSSWDTRSAMHLVAQVQGCNTKMHYDLVEVFLDPLARRSDYHGRDWHSLIQKTPHSLISIGSARASLASEVMLAQMLNVEPFRKPDQGIGSRPFGFIWESQLSRGVRSAFAFSPNDILDANGKLARRIKHNQAAAFLIRGKKRRPEMEGSATHKSENQIVQICPIEKRGKTWTMYGTIAVQRRSNGHVWMVISGISGPATFAAATLVDSVKDVLPFRAGENSPVLIAPIIAKVAAHTSKPGDNREVTSCRLLPPSIVENVS